MNPFQRIIENQNKALLKYELMKKFVYTCKVCGKTNLSFKDVEPYFWLQPQYELPTAVYGVELKDGQLVWKDYALHVCSEECQRKFILNHNYFFGLLMENVGLPEGTPAYTFDNLRNESNSKLIDQLKERIHNEQTRGFYLCGNPGTGKTSLAVACAYEWRKLGYNVRFACMSDVQAFLRANFDIEGALRPLVFDPNGQPWDVIVVDDLTNAFDGKFGQMRMKELMVKWYEFAITCIFTSNIDAQTFGKSVADSIVDRLMHMCECLDMPKVNYRKNKVKENGRDQNISR